jgi:uncharacterized membrane protein
MYNAHPEPAGLGDGRLEAIVGTMLHVGVIVASVVVLAGGVAYLVQSGGTVRDYHVFHPASLRTIAGVLHEMVTLNPAAIIQCGVLLLIATPVARVAFSVYAFARQHDRTYVIVTLIVLAALLYSLARGPG